LNTRTNPLRCKNALNEDNRNEDYRDEAQNEGDKRGTETTVTQRLKLHNIHIVEDNRNTKTTATTTEKLKTLSTQ
jgi:hypothetical protein